MEAWISSRVLPLVSGTSRSTNTTVSPQMLAKMKNVPAFRPSHTQIYISSEFRSCCRVMKLPASMFMRVLVCYTLTKILFHLVNLELPYEFHTRRKLKAYETIHEPSQLTSVTRLPAAPFMFMGKICMSNSSIL